VKDTERTAGSRIAGIGAHRPGPLVGNDAFDSIGSSDAWVRKRTGIVGRRFAAAEESVIEMALAATRDALAGARLEPSEVDLLLVATSSNPVQTPAVAPQVTARLGIGAAATDVAAGCAGFCYGLALASDAVRGGSAQAAVVVGAEKLSDGLDFSDRSTCPLFGDGAGAAVVAAADSPGIGPVVWGSDGTRSDLIGMSRTWREFVAAPEQGQPYLRVKGVDLLMWAAKEVVPVARRACDLAGVAPEELAAFVPHQANMRLVTYLAGALKLTDAVVADDGMRSANTSAASVPLALHDLVDRNEVRSGDLALLVAFGAGLCFAAQVVACP
jgi:3-oxoacyl-(acyl-carrier-protein) synthase III